MQIGKILPFEQSEVTSQQTLTDKAYQEQEASEVLSSLTNQDEDAVLTNTTAKAGAGNEVEAFSITELLENNDNIDKLNNNMDNFIKNDPNLIFSHMDENSIAYQLLWGVNSHVTKNTSEEMDGWTLSHLASMDSNADGCITSDEQQTESDIFMRMPVSFESDGGDAECIGEFSTEHYGVTIYNGQKVYALSTNEYLADVKGTTQYDYNDMSTTGGVSETISLTESELAKLTEYYCKYGENAPIEGALSAIGIKSEIKTINGKECLCFTGCSGVQSVIFKSAGYRHGGTFSYDNSLWLACKAMNDPNFEYAQQHKVTGEVFEKIWNGEEG